MLNLIIMGFSLIVVIGIISIAIYVYLKEVNMSMNSPIDNIMVPILVIIGIIVLLVICSAIYSISG